MLKTAIILLVFGIVYLVRPGLYASGFWKKVVLLPASANPEKDKKFVRALGGLFVVAALCMLAVEWTA
ncbi:MAG: hypothetical protein ABW019_08430 [Chitinophagaceae bacterium]